jgi:hypothetical protein
MGFLTRGARPEGTLLLWRVRLFSAGGVLGMAGILLEERWLTGLAIVVLGAGALIRFLAGGTPPEGPEDPGDT